MENEFANERLNDRRKEYQDLVVELRTFIAEIKEWRKTTDEFRKTLSDKICVIDIRINNVDDRLRELPCRERVALYDSIKGNIKLLWTFITLSFGAAIGAWFKK